LSNTLAQVQALVADGQIRLSLHGFREMAADGIMLDDLLGNLDSAVTIEDYFDANRDRRFWCYKGTWQRAPFTWCGVFEKVVRVRLCL
jgi:hypothetical protein